MFPRSPLVVPNFIRMVRFLYTLLFLAHINSSLLSAQAAAPAGVFTTVGGQLASKSEKLFNEAAAYAAAKDQPSLDRLIATKRVFRLKDGIRVEVLETQASAGKIRIRPVGMTVELWTVSEAVTAVGAASQPLPEADGRPAEAKSSAAPPASQPVAKSPKYKEGYEAGFNSGEAAHNRGEAEGFRPPFVDLMMPRQKAEHDAAEKDGATNYQAGRRQGFSDGMAGLARGGLPQPALPQLPFVEKSPRLTRSRILGYIKGVGGDEVTAAKALHALVKSKQTSDLFSVSASGSLGDETDFIRVVYDSKHKLLVYLRRTIEGPGRHRGMWRIWFGVEPKDFADKLPFGNLSIRSANCRRDNATTSPLNYQRHPEFGRFY